MTSLEMLYDTAMKNGIYIESFSLPLCTSLSTKCGKDYYIGIDKSKLCTSSEEAVIIAHEIGHCATDSFYMENEDSSRRKKCERLADEWAIKNLLPPDKFLSAYDHGCREPWEFAEELSVTVSFAQKAMEYYKDRILLRQR